ncbi:hypothetical protein SLW73_11680 [Glutamicibacter protophormiae]|uniref:hypothetical protein n=1 Tax=Glutamicibacter protophormiae TaxID=37930 RepID=UPI002A8141DF|nr:hypothetical protein [Glutamicibacter protophormiae]WPR63544.1 hypothetical protein SLW72_11685 [Glutamicibacter protophormiae]WPR67039.1 hypothetical protein SLW73_11680 [Glutamicibacter protophormiae]
MSLSKGGTLPTVEERAAGLARQHASGRLLVLPAADLMRQSVQTVSVPVSFGPLWHKRLEELFAAPLRHRR